MLVHVVSYKYDAFTVSSLNNFFHIHEIITVKKNPKDNINFYSATPTFSSQRPLKMPLLQKVPFPCLSLFQ